MSHLSSPAGARGQKRERVQTLGPMARKEALQGYLFVLPWIIGFVVFTFGPMLFSLYASFTNYNVTSKMDFIGIRNYTTLILKDKTFAKSLYNTLYYVVFMVPLTTVGTILLAVLLNAKVSGIRVFRTLFYMPTVLSGAALYILWMQLLSPSGLVNSVIALFGVQGPAWLEDYLWMKPAVILMSLWKLGSGVLLYLAAMQGISPQLYESALIDGAGAVRRFFRITLPLITPIIFFDIITSTIGGFQIFSEGYIMTESGNGGPMGALLFYNLYLWNNAFEHFFMGKAAAMAYILFGIVMVLTVINLKVGRKWVYYDGGDER